MSPLLPVAFPSKLSRFDVGVDPKDVAAKEVVFAAEYFFLQQITTSFGSTPTSRFDVGVDPKDVVFAAEKNIPISYLRNIEYGY